MFDPSDQGGLSVIDNIAVDKYRFRRLASDWRRETINLSSSTRMVMHRAYQQIIGMGPAAVPLILRELQVRPDWWFWALQAITEADPVPPEAHGSLEQMTAAWIEWGHHHGYLRR
jgi:hypothetical protein